MRVLCSSDESLYRPEAVRWRNRMGLLKPMGDAVVILPCSMRKPYSNSKSHQIFMKVSRRIQEVILTSPFGICPREMEKTYPIQSYDVATTGDWSHEEIKVVGEVLRDYVDGKEVLAHVAGGYRQVCEEYLDDCVFTCEDGRPISHESMDNLKNEMKKYYRLPRRQKTLHGLRSLAIYQFGPGGETLIPDDIHVKGRFHKRLFHDSEQIATLIMESGLYSLNLQGGRLLSEIGSKWVNIEFELKTNTLFAPGVLDADPNIVPRDEVVILNKGEVVGVGKAVLSGEEMVKASQGVAVRVRHRVK
jgi:archaeosine synthase